MTKRPPYLQDESHGPLSTYRIMAAVRERWWLPTGIAALAAVAAFALGSSRPTEHRATALILLSQTSVGATISGIATPYQDPARLLQTQLKIARVPEVRARVASQLASEPESSWRLSASGGASTDTLSLTATAGTSELAIRAAETYAREFVQFSQDLDLSQIRDSVRSIDREITRTRQDSAPSQSYLDSLYSRRQELQTLLTLGTQRTRILSRPTSAERATSTPTALATLGAALGLLIGLSVLAFLESSDRRVRWIETVEGVSGLATLGRIPTLDRRTRRGSGCVSILYPNSPGAEAFRLLAANLELANDVVGARTLMITSSVPAEGKTTTAANLAVALSRARRNTCVVDLDLRRPSLRQALGATISGAPGIVDVIRGHAEISDAIQTLPLPSPEGTGPHHALDFIDIGSPPPNPTDYLSSSNLISCLADLSARYEFVILDAPPVLACPDASLLGRLADGLLLIVRLDALDVRDLRQACSQAGSIPARALGTVVVGTSTPLGSYTYGGSRATRATIPAETT